MIEDGLCNLLHALAGNTTGQHRQTASRSPSPLGTLIDWNLYNVNEDMNLAPSAEQQHVALIVQDLLDHLDNLSVSSADDEVEQSDDEHSADEPIVTSMFHFHLKNYSCWLMTVHHSVYDEDKELNEEWGVCKCACNHDPGVSSWQWFPWANKIVS